MTLEPLLQAPLAVQIHVATVLPAALLGAFLLLWRGKGSPLHRMLGKMWMLLMVATALSSFFIHELNVWHGFSPIHILSVITIVGCYNAYRLARSGNIRAHRIAVTRTYVSGILIAGGFTLLPYRIMNQVVFSGSSAELAALIGILICIPVFFYRLPSRSKSAP